MTAILVELGCAQCGKEVPADPERLSGWRNGELVFSGDYDDVLGSLLLCPDCVEDDHVHAFDDGGESG